MGEGEQRGDKACLVDTTRVVVCLGIATAGLVAALAAYHNHNSSSEDGGGGGEVDDGEEEEVSAKDERDFDRACDFVASTSLVSVDVFESRELLELYGLYKQATVGDCGGGGGGGGDEGEGWTKRWSRWVRYLVSSVVSATGVAVSPKEVAKRRAWRECAGMKRSLAMTMYVGKVLAKAVQKDIDFTLDGEEGEDAGMHSWVTNSTLRDPYQDNEEEGGEGDAGAGGGGGGTSNWYDAVAENSGVEGVMEELLRRRGSGGAGQQGGSTDIDLSERDGKERTLLHWATDHGNLELVCALLRNEADPNCQDADGQTPLHYAAMCEYREIYDVLVEGGADESKVDGDGETPAMWAPDHWKTKPEGEQFIGWKS
ncbi:acyl-CoA-binding domain-containing protein [Chloropicon primus]|uniref:Acyl-CoA-binding domain-containing protein n=3 Tax=Chloropicon primus TaxID=1764295 RepID=A0A5B8MWL2_9CHLO|nr:acyl-CoA-binding domain-containing protein [Chloropicon primus]UPR04057.1 acyl-CoA-binding domain-containing protein [Chloropicon primus]|eukprot:QDZ24847.1 acyl-CoA-binding domain-containing protein [Chloropicon primus]